MEPISDFPLFLLSVILISLSGVMAPGPLFAVTIAKGLKKKTAGLLTSLGHGIIEFPLIFLIYFGFSRFFSLNLTQKVVGLVGGVLMIYLGIRMVRTERKKGDVYEETSHGSVIAGIFTTGANPYFLLWWATVGTSLIINAAIFGSIGVILFAIAHWLCDLLWNTFVSAVVYKSRRFVTQKVKNIIFGFCFAVLVSFGALFIVSALLS
jgi:threonine/homoserine/homoserine lactone efflux protein